MHEVSAQTFFSDAPYEGTCSMMKNNAQSGRARRGRARLNKAEPRGMTGHRYPRKPSNKSTRDKIEVRAAVVPEVVRRGMTNNIGRDYS